MVSAKTPAIDIITTSTAIALVIAAATSVGAISIANACTSAVYNNGDVSMTVRTMVWSGQDQAKIVGKGKGIENTYGKPMRPSLANQKMHYYRLLHSTLALLLKR
ncbi:hypothetical protein BCV02_17815 [Vibrio breoganii]|nr:hypothetical protein BCV02_17815 [Vibrio breoganii]PMG91273.1 hypothetical protein BCU79_17445 [Vibrio breoganii]PML86539.1 hypothetical protein BCT67_13630 [Vibrio breoganii]